MAKASTNIDRGFTATASWPDIEVEKGQQLTKRMLPTMIAYWNSTYQDAFEEALEISSDEMVNTINKCRFVEGMETDEIEQAVLDALYAHKHGTSEEDIGPVVDVAIRGRKAQEASHFGALLPTSFDEHAEHWVESIQFVRMGPIYALDDIAGRVYNNLDRTDDNWKGGAWSREQIIAMPVPGTRAPKDVDVTDANRDQWDLYKYEVSGGIVSSSWTLDILSSTKVGARILDEIREVENLKEGGETLRPKDAATLANLKKELDDALKYLRNGLFVSKGIIELERAKGAIKFEVQREEDQTPAKKSKYPMQIWPSGKSGERESFTLAQLKALLRTDNNGENAMDRTLAYVGKHGGGIWEAFRKVGLPKKVRGKNKTKVDVLNISSALGVLGGLARYVESAGGATQFFKALDDKATGSSVIWEFGQAMSVLAPIWDKYQQPYLSMVEEQRKLEEARRAKAAATIAEKHNAKVA